MKTAYKITIIGLLLSTQILMMWTFFGAFLHGYSVTITVNDYHEAWFEAIMIPLTFLLGMWLVASEIKIYVRSSVK